MPRIATNEAATWLGRLITMPRLAHPHAHTIIETQMHDPHSFICLAKAAVAALERGPTPEDLAEAQKVSTVVL